MGCGQSTSGRHTGCQQSSASAELSSVSLNRYQRNNDGILATVFRPFRQFARCPSAYYKQLRELVAGPDIEHPSAKASANLVDKGLSVVDESSFVTPISSASYDNTDPEIQGRLKDAIQALESNDLDTIVNDLLDSIATSSAQIRFQDILDLACDGHPDPSYPQFKTLCNLSNLERILRMRSDGSNSSRARSSERFNRLGDREAETSPIYLFTSVQQLCRQVIGNQVLRARANSKKVRNQPLEDNILCLFLFGCQGSSKGELVVELLEHSALSKALDGEEVGSDNECPLYHHIDVASVIVANLNDRIREYKSIQADIVSSKAIKESTIVGSESEESDNQTYSRLDVSVKTQYSRRHESLQSEASLNAKIQDPNTSASSSSDEEQKEELGLMSLSTKLRSVLQMKLMKFSNCVTSKWIFGLIRAEIDRIELRVSKALNSRTRVYLINLIPNQLSLFKSCIYLKQSIALRELSYSQWAICFERRTNIKLLKKDRMNPNSAGAHNSPALRLSNFILPLSLPLGSSYSKTGSKRVCELKLEGHRADRANAASSSANKSQRREELRTLAANVILNSLNEKIGPKIQDHFVQQFRMLNRLTVVRYNPLHDYNYALDSQHQPSSCADIADASSLALQMNKNPIRPSSADPRSLTSSNTTHEQEASALESRAKFSLNESSGQNSVPGRFLPSNSSFSSLDSHESASVEIRTNTKTNSLIKWAVELELSSQGFRPQQFESDMSLQRHKPTLIFREPKSRSPTLFKSQSNAVEYKLVAVQVVYATGSTNTLFEIKRVHQRPYKLKSLDHVEELIDLVRKARRRLQHDCQTWLNDVIRAKHCETVNLAPHGYRRRASIVSPMAGRSPATDWIPASLIVYKINVDVSRICSDSQMSLTGQVGSSPLIPVLTLNNSQDQLINQANPDQHRARRRVQFRLAPAPARLDIVKQSSLLGDENGLAEPQAGVQRRQWIDSTLFVSANCEQVTSSVLKLMPVLASVVQGKSCE